MSMFRAVTAACVAGLVIAVPALGAGQPDGRPAAGGAAAATSPTQGATATWPALWLSLDHRARAALSAQSTAATLEAMNTEWAALEQEAAKIRAGLPAAAGKDAPAMRSRLASLERLLTVARPRLTATLHAEAALAGADDAARRASHDRAIALLESYEDDTTAGEAERRTFLAVLRLSPPGGGAPDEATRAAAVEMLKGVLELPQGTNPVESVPVWVRSAAGGGLVLASRTEEEAATLEGRLREPEAGAAGAALLRDARVRALARLGEPGRAAALRLLLDDAPLERFHAAARREALLKASFVAPPQSDGASLWTLANMVSLTARGDAETPARLLGYASREATNGEPHFWRAEALLRLDPPRAVEAVRAYLAAANAGPPALTRAAQSAALDLAARLEWKKSREARAAYREAVEAAVAGADPGDEGRAEHLRVQWTEVRLTAEDLPWTKKDVEAAAAWLRPAVRHRATSEKARLLWASFFAAVIAQAADAQAGEVPWASRLGAARAALAALEDRSACDANTAMLKRGRYGLAVTAIMAREREEAIGVLRKLSETADLEAAMLDDVLLALGVQQRAVGRLDESATTLRKLTDRYAGAPGEGRPGAYWLAWAEVLEMMAAEGPERAGAVRLQIKQLQIADPKLGGDGLAARRIGAILKQVGE